MSQIRPFNGIRYNETRVGDLSAVVAPPYDVIPAGEQPWYYDRHPNNVVRLILPRGNGDKYERAAATLRDWLATGVLIRDDVPSIYAYRQEFEVLGRRMRRTGFTCLAKLEEFGRGSVLPHENVLAKPLEDRLNLTRATRANFDSVFGLVPDGRVETILSPFVSQRPDASAVDKDGIRSDLWRISDQEAIRGMVESLAGETIVIADGHHRYSAALAHRNEMRALDPGPASDTPYDYVMMTLVSLDDPGLVVLPTHRLVRDITDFDPVSFLARLGEMFDLHEAPSAAADRLADSVARGGNHAFGLHLRGKSYVVSLKPTVSPERAIESPGSDALKRLDVSVLHSLILDRLLGIGARQMSAQSHLSYSRDPGEAMQAVDRGDYQAFFLMNPTRVDEVKEVAAAGDRMPQKSTFFYPKLLTGLLMRTMTDH